MYMGLNGNTGQVDHAPVAELLARRWTDDRPYVTAIGAVWRAGIQASWQRGPDHTLSLHWARRTALEFERGAALTSPKDIGVGGN
jgi:hypothetical protein